MPSFTQSNRTVRIETPLGKDVLLVKSLTGTERLGRPFQYELVLLSEDHELDYKKIIGQNVTVFVDKGDKESRFFNGFVSRFSQAKYEEKLAEYHVTLVPWLWFLTRTSDCRIFQNKTIPEIIEEVFKDHGFSDVTNRLQGSYRKWDYCVQYRETAYNFVSRLMEEEGIYYYFKHEADKHSIVLCDSPASHKVFAGYEELLYRPSSANVKETLWSWVVQHEVQSGAYVTTDFDFTTPKKNTLANNSLDRGHSQSQLEQFDYLGEQSPFSEGERYSKLRLEEQQAQHETYSGEGDCRGVCTGVRFTLKGHPRKEFEKEYLTTSVEYQVHANPLGSTSESGAGFKYNAKLTATVLEEQFRSPRVTPKPIVHGPQTAIIVGPSGEKIYTDEYGRVKVQFHWDRVGQKDENSSCWIRVSQGWAGKNWGDMAIPHVGDEVIVECLEGDPDRPIITGRVYNQASMPPLELPTNKAKRIWRDDFGNEMIFDGTEGNEHIRLHSPHHNSFFDIGKSVNSFTNSDKQTAQIGNYYSATLGLSSTVVAGITAAGTLGINVGVNIGGVYNLCAGGLHNFTMGYQFSYSKGPIRNISSGDVNSISDQNNIVSAGEILCLVGGNNVSPIPKVDDNTSIIEASEARIRLSVGEKTHVDDSMGTKAKVALFLSLLFAAGSAAGTVAAMCKASDSRNYDSDHANENPWIPGGVSMLTAILSMVAGGVFARQIAKPIDVVAAQHKDPKGSIEMSGNGNILINSQGDLTIQQGKKAAPDGNTITLKADGTIEINSTASIVLASQAVLDIKGGGGIKFSGANIAAKGPVNLCGGALEVIDPSPPPPPKKKKKKKKP